MRSFALGLVIIVGLGLTVLSLRPGGLRRQLTFAARRFRIALILGGVYLLASTAIRVFFSQGWVADYGPPGVALVLGAVFLVAGRDPAGVPDTPRRSRTP